MLITRQIPTLYNGVSQMPAPSRLPSQCEAQVNATSSVVEGVRKRSPFEHIAKLTSDHLGTAYLHVINRDISERYTVIVTEAGIRVFDFAGVEKTVTAPLGYGYLELPDGTEARKCYACVTVADYTFVVNKTKVIGMCDVGQECDPPSDDYWWLNRPLSDAPAPLRAIDDPGEGGGGGGGGGGGVVPPTSPGYGGIICSSTLTGTKQTLQDLPTTGLADGQVYKIVGTDESAFQSYYVVHSGGMWYETAEPNLKNLPDALTMPHALIRQADGTFVFGPFDYAPRRVGSEVSNPNPTFVGRTIKDVYFYRNRLGFCVDENVVLSRAGDFGNFYRMTVVDLLPDDVVDVAASEVNVTKMEYALPYQKSLLLFSDQTQFVLSHGDVITGATVSLDVATRYPMVPGVRPAAAGSDVYFASQGSAYGILREYYVNEDGVTHDASDVTAHVQQYIPFGISYVGTAAEFDSVFLLTDGAPNRIYRYRYYWKNETEKVQSAWWYYELSSDCTVLSLAALGGFLWALIDRADGTYLERHALFYGSLAGDLTFQTHLDRRCEVTGAYDSGTNKTTFTLPYTLPTDLRGDFKVVRGSDFGVESGCDFRTDQVTWTSGTTFTIDGDQDAGEVVCGLLYRTSYTFSQQYPRTAQGDAIHTGRLQLRTMTVHYTECGYFRAEVKPYGSNSQTVYKSEFPARRIGINGLGAVGVPTLIEGKARFAIQANAAEAEITLVNDSYLGVCFTSAEWEGFYHNRASA